MSERIAANARLMRKLFALLNYELWEITPEWAAELMASHEQNYRKLSTAVSKFYARLMAAHKWDLNIADALVFAQTKKNGFIILHNGQHRLDAVIRSNTTQPFVCLLLNETTLPIYNDLVVDWGMKRKTLDYFRAQGYGNKTLTGLTTFLHRQLTGVKSRSTPDEIGQVYLAYGEGIDFAASKENCPYQTGITTPVRGAIARAYYTQDLERLAQFGNMLATGGWRAPQGEDSAVRLMSNIIYRNNKLKYGGGAGAQDNLYVHCESAVAAFCARKTLKQLRAVSKVGSLLPLPNESIFTLE